ncbi:MAG: molybdenum cofactor guanylyltransferase [Anaerolineae bacterium]|nr:molybdenum cofactor guanylyltransferase [Anaerolineae bacterium]
MMAASHSALSLAIIAGGQSRRMGRDKAFVELGGRALIERVIQRSADLGQAETILITNKPADYAHLGLPMHRDILPDTGSLGGIYTALVKATSPAVLVLACDMPFINADLLRFMLTQLDADTDIVVPRVDGYPQALHAIYQKTCIAPIRAQLEANRLKIIRFYDQMRVRYLDETDYAEFDPVGGSFANLNTPAELEQARQLLRTERSS